MSSTSSSNSSASVSRPKRIFCYGDSLTAGTAPPSDQLFPYGPHLEDELNKEGTVMVRWRGLPGWTASTMVDFMDDSTYGLRAAVDGIRNPSSVSLVIILAGTNDIGSYTSSMMTTGGGGGGTIDASSAVEPILQLHNACLNFKCQGDGDDDDDNGTQHNNIQTLAVGIPGSAWQEMNADAKKLCSEMNDALQAFASREDNYRVSYMEFPFAYQRGDSKWSGDGLHLSSEGYELLGRSLAPCVKLILDGLD